MPIERPTLTVVDGGTKRPRRQPVPRDDRPSMDRSPIAWPPDVRTDVVNIIAGALVVAYLRDRERGNLLAPTHRLEDTNDR